MSREPIFNVPATVLWTLALLAAVQVIRSLLPDEQDHYITLAMAFIPARYAGAASELPGGDVASVTSFVTYMLVHGNLSHLIINCAWLLAFGGALARRIGGLRFLAFSTFCGIAAIAFYLVFHFGAFVPVVGASGAVSGLMAAALRFFMPAIRSGGLGDLRSRPGQVPLASIPEMLRDPQILAVIGIWIALNFLFGLGGATLANGASIAWEAHLGGFLIGLFTFSFFDRRQDSSTQVLH